ncbi:GABA-B receptor R2 [Oopsacas minuta]|uniref:GABA-B receptor R2 n=1 Tax=Oopsacas minuta TaxID=111878 RepID=A0AAV7K856_9METZ|nr:GABA-B receptor R2 [Oopsacas minuta]
MKLILLSIIWLVLQIGKGQGQKDLVILGLYPERGGWSLPLAPLSSTLALNDINSRPDLLSGYNFRVDWKNSDCSNKVALESFINSLISNETYLGVFGPGCSIAAVAIANISPAYGLITFTYAAASPSLEDKERYPYFIRGSLSDTNIAIGRINFIASHGWERVAIFNQQEEIFVYNSYAVQQVLRDLNIDYRTATFDTQSQNVEAQIYNAIDLIDNLGYRIIIANMYENAAVSFICQLKLTVNPLPYLTWLMIGWYTRGWDEQAYNITNGKCTTQDIRDVINGAIGIIPYQLFDSILQSNHRTISGLTPQELYNEYEQIALDNNLNFVEERDSLDAYLYDSLWTYALGLNQTIADGYDPETFNYSNFDFTNALYMNTYSQAFNGWTGDVTYFGRERQQKTIQVVEFVDGRIEYRGYYTNFSVNPSQFGNTTNVISNISDFKIWQEDRASDGIKDRFTSFILFGVVLATSTCVVIYVTVLIIVILIGVKKNLPPAKKSEPLINIVILATNYIIVLIAVLFTIDGKFFSTLRPDAPQCIIYCHAQVMLASVSGSILYGAVLAKASKYYFIVVKNKFRYTGWLQARYLLLFPTVLVLFDVVLIIAWGLISPITYQSFVISSGVTDPPLIRIYRCEISDNVGFVVALGLVNTLLILIALFLAYHLRKVVNKSHRYSSVIVWLMYTSVVFNLIIILLLVFVTEPNIRLALSAIFTNIIAFIIASIIGLPVVYYLIKDPKGVTFFKTQAQDEFPEDIQLLKLRITALERDLQVYKDKEAEHPSGLQRMVNRIRKSTMFSGSINESYQLDDLDSPAKKNPYAEHNEKRTKTFA